MSSTPQYLFEEIPPERDISYNLRHAWAYDPIIPRTVRFSNTYFRNVLYEWTLLDNEIKNSASLGGFKRKVLAMSRPSRNPIFIVDNITGIKRLTKLRVKLAIFKTGNGERGTGNGERGTGNGERGTGNGERGTGNGERGTGNGERHIFEAICFMSTLQLYPLSGNTLHAFLRCTFYLAFPFNSFTHTISFRLQM